MTLTTQMKRIEERAEDVEYLFEQFRKQQTELGGSCDAHADKQALQDKLEALEDELNGYLAGEYKVDIGTNNLLTKSG